MYYQLLNQKDIFTLKFIVALFTIDKIRKQPKCPLIDKWKKEHVLYIYLMELPSHKKKGWDFAICYDVDGPRECHAKCQTWERQIPYDFAYMWNFKKKMSKQTKSIIRSLNTENKLKVVIGEGGGKGGG